MAKKKSYDINLHTYTYYLGAHFYNTCHGITSSHTVQTTMLFVKKILLQNIVRMHKHLGCKTLDCTNIEFQHFYQNILL